MARRKSTEVLISGDKVDARERVGPITPVSETPPVKKKPVGAFPEDHMERRPRKKPKIIDVSENQPPKTSASDDLAELERELGMVPTAAPGEALTGSVPLPAQTSAEKDKNWQKIQRAKKPVHDLPPQADPPPKSITTDDFVLSQPVVLKPQADIAAPPAPAAKKANVAPPPAPTAKKTNVAAARVTPPTAPKKASTQPVKTKKSKALSLKAQSAAIAQTVVTSILDRIRAEAQKNGGQLSLANIDSLQAEFGAQTQALSLAFEQSFEAYVLARERAAWDNKRDFPFDRLIVKKFSHLFSDRSAKFDRVSRRMLPGFFMAMGMMLGPDVVDEFQEKCRVIVERIRSAQADEFDWSDVYDADKDAQIIMDALVPIARHFDDFEMRREWFVNLINGHLSRPNADDKEDAGWELTNRGFNLFLNALLADLRVQLNDVKEKPRITKRYGASDVNILLRTLKKIGPS